MRDGPDGGGNEPRQAENGANSGEDGDDEQVKMVAMTFLFSNSGGHLQAYMIKKCKFRFRFVFQVCVRLRFNGLKFWV